MSEQQQRVCAPPSLQDEREPGNDRTAEVDFSCRDVEHLQRMASLGALTTSLVHEISNLLCPVLANTHFAHSCLPTTPMGKTAEELNDAVEESLTGLDRIAKLVVGVRKMAHRPVNDRQALNLEDVLTTAIAISLRPHSKQIAIREHFASTDPVLGDEPELLQVFVNLINNAVHACEGRDTKRVEIHLSQVGDSALIQVLDTGHGLAACSDGLFEPFHTTKPPGKGTGLGLTISRNIVRRHGGRIALVSRSDSTGAMASVLLPTCASSEGGPNETRDGGSEW